MGSSTETFFNSAPAIYSTEAYYSDNKLLIPMDNFAADLLEAKSEADVELICNKYHYEHVSFSPYADPNIYRMSRTNPWRFKATDAFVPSYASWLLEYVRTLSVCLQLYAVCLPIARESTKNSETTDMFNLLYYAHTVHQRMVTEVYHNYEWIPHQDIRERRIHSGMRYIPKFPLVSLFDSFQKDEGRKLQNRYGYTFKQIRRRGDQSPPQSQYHYWENTAAAKAARERLWGYTSQHRTDDDDVYILKWDVKALSLRYLEILDQYLGGNLEKLNFKMDSAAGTAKLLTGNIKSALSLWVFTQIQARTDYRVCKMCGRLFIPGSQKGKKYCDLHKKYEINYYNKTIGRLETTVSPPEYAV